VPLISLLEAVPVSIYGLGLRDTGYVLFLTQTGHTRGEAAALSLLYVSATLLYASVGGMIWAARRAQRETQT
jgi:glycosyltransferase 2 family protein